MRFAARTIMAATALLTLADAAAAWNLPVCADPNGAPYSSADGKGFDNRVAEAIVEELGADLSFVWMTDHKLRTQLRHLHAGDCDMVMGVIEGQSGVLNSLSYYRTGYVFVSSASSGPTVTTLDDPVFAGLKVGLTGGARKPTPPALALSRRGYLAGLRHFGTDGMAGRETSAIVEALHAGEIDLAILWGPTAGTMADSESGLALAPVKPEIDMPFMPMVAAFTIGVRPHDEALRDAIDRALAVRWDEIAQILAEARVPTLPLPRPVEHREAMQ